MSIPVEVNRRIARARKKETNCAIFTDVISMVCTLIEDYSRPISVRESLSYGKKELTGGFKTNQKSSFNSRRKKVTRRGEGEGEGEGKGGGEGGEGEKREQGKWKRTLTLSPQSPYLFPSFQSSTTFDACYAGYQKSRNILNEQ